MIRVCFFATVLLFSIIVACQNGNQVKHAQYMAEGFTIYKAHCANCHQLDGKGLQNLYPPISKDYINNRTQLICLIKYGINQPMQIEGQLYHRAMPANPDLQDLDIAELVTYLETNWGSKAGIVTVNTVQQALNACLDTKK